MMLYDVFISHASEDKDAFVRPLVDELKKRHIETWYDEFSLHPGDSLRQSIDRGLSRSRYGIVVLSPHFFKKKWPQWELDGLVQRQLSGSQNVIIPIWHGVTVHQIQEYSPSLANIVAINSTIGIGEVSQKIFDLVHPQGSSLIIAREILFTYGVETPVITDDWWLKIVEASATVYRPSYMPYKTAGDDDSWQFPLPPKDGSPNSIGKRLAWTALQLSWQQNVRKANISQISHPHLIHEFIKSQPGLREICIRFPKILMESAPQLLIPEFSEEFGPAFDRLLENSVKWYKDFGLGGTHHLPLLVKEGWEVDIEKLDDVLSSPPSKDFVVGAKDKCTPLLTLRHPSLTKINPTHTAYEFFRYARPYDNIDYVAWFLSDASLWLPDRIRNYLSDGLKKWGVWPWDQYLERRKDFPQSDVTGSLATALKTSESYLEFKVTDNIIQDVRERLSFASKILNLTETGDDLTERFFASDWIRSWFEREWAESDRRRKKSRDQRKKKSFKGFRATKYKDDFFLE